MKNQLLASTTAIVMAAALTQFDSKAFAAAETYNLLDYYHPVFAGNEWVYDAQGIEFSKMIRSVDAVSFPITSFRGRNPVVSFQTNVVSWYCAYGDYDSPGHFTPGDFWYDYQIANVCFGLIGSDDDPGVDEMRVNPGFVMPNRLAVGQVVLVNSSVYTNGAYNGTASIKGQIVGHTNITVPAGIYSDCLHLKFIMVQSGKTQVNDEWWAKGVGMVKKTRKVSKPGHSYTEEYVLSSASFVSPPRVSMPPLNQSIHLGRTASLTVTSLGDEPLSYFWQRNGTNLLDDGNISGTSSTNLTIANFQAGDAGSYSVVVTNAYGCVTSSVTVLAVLPIVGNYAGLFYDPNGVTTTNAGFVTISVTKGGKFTARLQQGARSYPFSGQFSLSGGWGTNFVKGTPGWGVWLQLSLDGGDEVTGVVSNAFWTAELAANRSCYSKTNPAPQAGKYTLVMPGSDDPDNLPYGCGAAAVNVSRLGVVSVNGALGDGTPVTQSTFVSEQGQWPLYAAPYSRKGILIGWLTFTNNTATTNDLEGVVSWIKPGGTGTKIYTNGFNWPYDIGTNNVFGSVFTNKGPLLGWTNGVLTLEGGNLPQNITNGLVMGNTGKSTGTNRLSGTIATTGIRAGLFKGSIVDPVTKKTKVFNGALLQKQNIGYGWFLGTNQSGRVCFGPEP